MKRTHIKPNTAEGQTKRFGVGMLSPTVVILLIMTAYPLIFTFFYSFTNYNLLRNLRSPAKITFFQNYVKLLKDVLGGLGLDPSQMMGLDPAVILDDLFNATTELQIAVYLKKM